MKKEQKEDIIFLLSNSIACDNSITIEYTDHLKYLDY